MKYTGLSLTGIGMVLFICSCAYMEVHHFSAPGILTPAGLLTALAGSLLYERSVRSYEISLKEKKKTERENEHI